MAVSSFSSTVDHLSSVTFSLANMLETFRAEFSWTACQSVVWWFRGPDVKGFCSQNAWELVSAISQYVAFVKCGGLVVP